MGTSSSADLRLGFGFPGLPGASPASIAARSASWARAVGGLRGVRARREPCGSGLGSDDGTFGVDWKCLSHLHFSGRSEFGTPKPSDFPGLWQPGSARLASQDCAPRPGRTLVTCREI